MILLSLSLSSAQCTWCGVENKDLTVATRVSLRQTQAPKEQVSIPIMPEDKQYLCASETNRAPRGQTQVCHPAGQSQNLTCR